MKIQSQAHIIKGSQTVEKWLPFFRVRPLLLRILVSLDARLSQKSISTLMILIKWMKADLIHVDNQRYTKNIIIFVRVNLQNLCYLCAFETSSLL